jgi:hypothetical protein
MLRYSKWMLFLMVCHHVFDVTLTDYFKYHGQFIEADNIAHLDQGKMSK